MTTHAQKTAWRLRNLEKARQASRDWKARNAEQVRAYATGYNKASWERTRRLSALERAEAVRRQWWEGRVA